MKKILSNTFTSVAVSLLIFAVIGIVYDVKGGGSFTMEGYSFTRMVTACAAIGLGFGLPSGIYDNEALPMGIKVLIHMGIGCTVYIIAAYFAGWIPADGSPAKTVLIIAAELVLAFLIWTGYYIYNIRLSRRMNKKIKNLGK